MYLGAAALEPSQLLTSLQAGTESVRGAASVMNSPRWSPCPENLLTLLAPGFFGNMTHCALLGTLVPVEMCLFIGIVVCLWQSMAPSVDNGSFARAGPTLDHSPSPRPRFEYSPVPRSVSWGPGFDRLRGNAKIHHSRILFMAMLAGTGLDHTF